MYLRYTTEMFPIPLVTGFLLMLLRMLGSHYRTDNLIWARCSPCHIQMDHLNCADRFCPFDFTKEDVLQNVSPDLAYG